VGGLDTSSRSYLAIDSDDQRAQDRSTDHSISQRVKAVLSVLGAKANKKDDNSIRENRLMTEHWYYCKGPFSDDELTQLASSGQLKPTDKVWKNGMSGWLSASEISGLYNPADHAPPPLTVPDWRETLRKAIEIVGKKLDELDCHQIYKDNADLCCGIGKEAWHTPTHWTSGLWICAVDPGNLTCEDETAPYAMVLINFPIKPIDLQAAVHELITAAKLLLPKEDFESVESKVNVRSAHIWWRPRQLQRDELLGLWKRGEDCFINRIAGYFEVPMAGFIPILDKILL
jgi:hypothetical protein